MNYGDHSYLMHQPPSHWYDSPKYLTRDTLAPDGVVWDVALRIPIIPTFEIIASF